MTKYIDKELAERIKEETKLIDIIEGYIDLKKKSANIFTGQCPMCKSDAFNVNTKKKIFKCFKCDWGGNNAVKFLQETQNMNYNEALVLMAEKSNIVIPEKQKTFKPKTGPKDTSFKNRQLAASGLDKKCANTECRLSVCRDKCFSRQREIISGERCSGH